MMDRKREIAKFFSGAEAFHALVHAVLLVSGSTVSVFGITPGSTWNLVGVAVNAGIAFVLAFYGWGDSRDAYAKTFCCRVYKAPLLQRSELPAWFRATELIL